MEVFLSIPSDYCVYYTTLSAHRHVFFLSFKQFQLIYRLLKNQFVHFCVFCIKTFVRIARKDAVFSPRAVRSAMCPAGVFSCPFPELFLYKKTGEPVPGLNLSKKLSFSDNLYSDCAEHESSERSHAEAFSLRTHQSRDTRPRFGCACAALTPARAPCRTAGCAYGISACRPAACGPRSA